MLVLSPVAADHRINKDMGESSKLFTAVHNHGSFTVNLVTTS